jgi:hypothetical protein
MGSKVFLVRGANGHCEEVEFETAAAVGPAK